MKIELEMGEKDSLSLLKIMWSAGGYLIKNSWKQSEAFTVEKLVCK